MVAGLRAKLIASDEGANLYGNAFAAVAVLLRERKGLEVLLTKRAEREDDPWSAQWSFPGGRRKEGESLLETACRETEEEVHLRPQDGELLGCMEARSPANRPEWLVLPFLFRWVGVEEPRAGPEVAETAWIPVAGLPASRTTVRVGVRGHGMEMPAFVHQGRVIWGFTYRALDDLLKLL